MEHMFPRSESTVRAGFLSRFFGVFLSRRKAFEEVGKNPSWLETLLFYFTILAVNIGLALLFFKLFGGEAAGLILGEIWGRLIFMLVCGLLLWVLCIVIYHGLCKLANGKASILSSLSLGAFIYSFTLLLIPLFMLIWFVITTSSFWTMFLLELLFLFILIWIAIAAIRGFSAIHGISLGKSFIFFIIVLIIVIIILILAYFAIVVYLIYLLAQVL